MKCHTPGCNYDSAYCYHCVKKETEQLEKQIAELTLTPSEREVIADCRKMNIPWEKHIPYHCNCDDQNKDPRVCPEHGRVKTFATDVLTPAIPAHERKDK